MLSDDQRDHHPDVDVEVRDIHALTPPPPPQPQPPPPVRGRLGELWDNSSSSSSEVENFTTMSREFSALVVAGSTMQTSDHHNSTTHTNSDTASLGRIGEEEETNPLAIVPDTNYPVASPRRRHSSMAAAPGPSVSSADNSGGGGSGSTLATAATAAAAAGGEGAVSSVHAVRKEEVESKIGAWQTAEVAKINNRFKREDVIINGWESEQVEKATTTLKKIERKLEEKRARAIEKMQNEVARAHRKAEEKRASAEAKRGTKVAKVLELSNLLRAVGRAPSKRSIF